MATITTTSIGQAVWGAQPWLAEYLREENCEAKAIAADPKPTPPPAPTPEPPR